MNLELHARRQLPAELRQQRAHAVRDFHRVRSWLLLHRKHERRFCPEPRGRLIVLDVIENFADVLEVHRASVAPRDGDATIIGRFEKLTVRLNGVGSERSVENAGRKIDVAAAHGIHHFVDADAARRELPRIDLNAHGVLLRAVNLNLRDAFDGRDALRHERLGVFVEVVHRHRLRCERKVDDRGVGGIDFAVRRRRGHVRRELARGRGDCRLHVLRCVVEIAR